MPCGGRASRERRGAARDGGTWDVIPGGKDIAMDGAKGGNGKGNGNGKGKKRVSCCREKAVG